ncbi:unnamed protein product [Leptidea sinapis]|uniref:FP protein C-terminal domain-containing protein n=1 Tax=Leptidea sinapis TaxID=189913 RepID=A0A5E4QI87_9NEOP|nr:unnamed protein product [Leptidea sinapis]
MEELKLHMSELFNSQMTGIKDAIINLTETIKAQNSRIQQLEDRVSQLEKSTDLSVLENKIQKLSIKIVEKEQTLLANDIEFSGCPEVQNESAMHIIKTIAHKIGISINEKDIVNVERVGPRRPEEKDKPYRPRPLIVRLTRRETRDALLTAARVRRGFNTEGLQLPGPTRSLYINERLSGHNRYLFQKARLLASELKFKYVWTRDGKIYVRQEQGKERSRIREESDLFQVFGKS